VSLLKNQSFYILALVLYLSECVVDCLIFQQLFYKPYVLQSPLAATHIPTTP